MGIDLDLLTVSKIAQLLHVSQQYVRRLINEKKILAQRVGGQWLIEKKELQVYFDKYNLCVEPMDHERLSDSVPPIIALSFFSGAMGLDIGMKNGGIPALLACEFNKFCRMTIQTNEPEMALIGDINNIMGL